MDDSGFEIVEQALSSAECDELSATIRPVSGKSDRAGIRHLLAHPGIGALARKESLLSIARRHVGAAAVQYRATLFDKSGVYNWLVAWHQDTVLPLRSRVESPEWGPWSEKEGVLYARAPIWALVNVIALRVHLDPSLADNGLLRVIPGSHLRGILSAEEIAERSRKTDAKVCVVDRGGVLAMRPLLIHASSRVQRPASRRVLHLEYSASLDLSLGVRLAEA